MVSKKKLDSALNLTVALAKRERKKKRKIENFALAGNRTRAQYMANTDCTTQPPMHLITHNYCYFVLYKNFLQTDLQTRLTKVRFPAPAKTARS